MHSTATTAKYLACRCLSNCRNVIHRCVNKSLKEAHRLKATGFHENVMPATGKMLRMKGMDLISLSCHPAVTLCHDVVRACLCTQLLILGGPGMSSFMI